MSKFFLRCANSKVIVVNAIVYLLYQFLVLIPVSKKMKLVNGDNNILDLNVFFLKGSLLEELKNYGEAGREFYVNQIWIDLIYPLIYGFLFAIVLVALSKNIKGGFYRVIYVLPIATVFIDYLENFGFYLCIKEYPNISSTLLNYTLSMNGIKWILVAFCGILVVILGLKKLLKK